MKKNKILLISIPIILIIIVALIVYKRPVEKTNSLVVVDGTITGNLTVKRNIFSSDLANLSVKKYFENSKLVASIKITYSNGKEEEITKEGDNEIIQDFKGKFKNMEIRFSTEKTKAEGGEAIRSFPK